MLKLEEEEALLEFCEPDSLVNDLAVMMDKLGISKDETVEEEVIPEHACSYCRVHAPECVAKCGGCDRWFCNHVSGSGGSHLIQHLAKSGHKDLSLHPASPIGDWPLKCLKCDCNNVFLLGYVFGEGDTVMLLCRTPCAESDMEGKPLEWNAWRPLIENRAFLPWIVKVPEGEALKPQKKIRSEDIRRLEAVWRTRPEATLEDLEEKPAVHTEINSIKETYANVLEYQSVMAPLVSMESQADKYQKAAQRLEGVQIRFQARGHNQIAIFSPPPYGRQKISVGEEVIIRHVQSGFKVTGVIVKAVGEIHVELCHGQPQSGIKQFSVEFVWSSATYSRMQNALIQLANDPSCVHPSILSTLLGEVAEAPNVMFKGPKNLSAPGLPQLNIFQSEAVKAVLSRPISLIQGPPGTGKTVTSATIVYQLAKLKEGPILVTAPSNTAVDNLAEKIYRTGLKVVRIMARCREDLPSPVSHLTLHELVQRESPELKRLYLLKASNVRLSDEDFRLIRKAETKILPSAQVICVTCVGAGDRRLDGFKFRAVVLDEATQAVEPQALIPIVRGASRQLVLVGDHKQLGPVVVSKKATVGGFNQSLFERLVKMDLIPYLLRIQYRMHPCLSAFSSKTFYASCLANGVTAEQRRRPELKFPWPKPDTPMVFLNCVGLEEISPNGTSYLNRGEASKVEAVVTKLLMGGIRPDQIGVITPYDGQRTYVQQHLQSAGRLDKALYAEVEVASVDAFQGREKDYIIVSCVRSSDHQGIGFLSDARRMNVALTRAKYGLIVLGNATVLSKNDLWGSLIKHFHKCDTLMEGSSLDFMTPLDLVKPAVPMADSMQKLQESLSKLDLQFQLRINSR